MVTLSNGESGAYVKWTPSEPTRDRYETKILMLVYREPSIYEGMEDFPALPRPNGVICQRRASMPQEAQSTLPTTTATLPQTTTVYGWSDWLID